MTILHEKCALKIPKFNLFLALLITAAVSGCSGSIKKHDNNNLSLDWTPILKDWEYGCNGSLELGVFSRYIGEWDEDTQDGVFRIGEIVLPQKYKNALGSIKIADINNAVSNGYSLFEIEVKYGDYYGIPITKFSFLKGHNNGLRANWIVFNTPYEVVRQKLNSVVYRAEETEIGTYQVELLEDKNKNETYLGCDYSD